MTPQTINAYYNPRFQRDRVPGGDPAVPVLRRRTATTRPTTAGSARSSVTRSVTASTTRDRSIDGDGRLPDWWTAADRQAFDERTGSLIEQYSALAPLQAPDQHVNGALTIGENIGDLGGAWHRLEGVSDLAGGEEPPVIDGFTGAQRFFLSWAQAWQQKARDEEVVRLLAIDPHSPNEFRCNQIVRNIDEFYDAFEVSADDELWLEPAAGVPHLVAARAVEVNVGFRLLAGVVAQLGEELPGAAGVLFVTDGLEIALRSHSGFGGIFGAASCAEHSAEGEAGNAGAATVAAHSHYGRSLPAAVG